MVGQYLPQTNKRKVVYNFFVGTSARAAASVCGVVAWGWGRIAWLAAWLALLARPFSHSGRLVGFELALGTEPDLLPGTSRASLVSRRVESSLDRFDLGRGTGMTGVPPEHRTTCTKEHSMEYSLRSKLLPPFTYDKYICTWHNDQEHQVYLSI